MKKLRKIILIFICAVTAALPCLAGCKKQNAVVITVKLPQSLTMSSVLHPEVTDTANFLKQAAEAFSAEYSKPVKLNVLEFKAGQEGAAVADTFGTADAADILYDNFFNMASFIHTGNAVPLDDVLPEGVKADLNEKYVAGGTLNGKLYMLPFSSSQNVMIYNKQLLASCGIDKPSAEGGIQSWSIDEWTEILNTLAEKLPEGAFPMMMYAADNQGDTHIMTLLRAFGSEIYDEHDNFNLKTAETVKALEWIQNGVTNGWFVQNPQNRTMTQCSNMFKRDKLCFYNFNLGSSLYPYVTAEGGFEKYGFVNYPGNNATFYCYGFEVYDNGDSEKIQISKDFIKFVYGTEKWLEYSAGNIPACNSVTEKYSDKILLLDEFYKNSANEIVFNKNLPNWQGNSASVRSVFYKEIKKLLTPKQSGGFTVTPEECAKNLNEVLNASLARGWEISNPHK